MKIAIAQFSPLQNSTEANIQKHTRLINLAHSHGTGLIVFPEMSLTGYERELASEMAFTEKDNRLEEFYDLSVLHKMIIMAGAPIQLNSGLHIGSFIFLPNRTLSIYTKQFLHEGEQDFFVPNFNHNPLIEWEGQKISFAICADITHPSHPFNAAANKTTLYLTSLFYTPSGIDEAFEQLSTYARNYSMNIVMANYSGFSYRFEAAGNSACWNNKGELIGHLDTQSEGILLAEYKNNQWSCEKIYI